MNESWFPGDVGNPHTARIASPNGAS